MLNWIMRLRRRRYIEGLVRRGLALGKNVELNDGYFLDPSHCFLITIEDGVTFGPGVRVFAHDASSLKCLGKTRIGLVRIGKNCFVGAGAVILPGVTVGEGSIVGANSTVNRNIPAGEVWAGAPAVRILSVADYAAMLRMRPATDFAEAGYRMGVITDERKREMIDALGKGRMGFMVP
jgi:maltose O-acetyltransferase